MKITAAILLALCTAALVPAASADSPAPSVRLTLPTAEEVVSGWTRLDAEASEDVVQVTYLLDGAGVAFDSTAPDWDEPWSSSSVADGRHTLVAEARDAAGNVATSEPISFVVDNDQDDTAPPTDAPAPTVSVTSPQGGAVVSGSVTVAATVTEDFGVAEVEYLVDGAVVASDATAPEWDELWDSSAVADGAHTLVARARDAAGNTATSSGVTFTVDNVADAAPPSDEGSCPRPYASTSPWNVPIPADVAVHPNSAFFVSSLTPTLTSDPTQYTYPVYEVDASTPERAVAISGRFSNVTGESTIRNQSGGSVSVPIPAEAQAAAGTDAQVILLDPATGDEWGFWQLERDSSGAWSATNGYRYNTSWSGVPPAGFVSRGAGVPYLAGLVRPCELERGFIDHALAFAYDYPSPDWIHPATKSDGKSTAANALPEGARLQLDPTLTRAELEALGITGPALVIAEALQRYGMYVIDNSGREKVMMEYEGTASWDGLITASTVSKIPLALFRWVETK